MFLQQIDLFVYTVIVLYSGWFASLAWFSTSRYERWMQGHKRLVDLWELNRGGRLDFLFEAAGPSRWYFRILMSVLFMYALGMLLAGMGSG
jgi:hypothetical protein